ncbi:MULTISPECIES: response regulator [unclassified Paenibacillus]|uniref:Response regulator n=1 Tax=Paenibacillus provencensis TaxID=441151 RepID=A0ABW3PU33_9BACL|nr:MULTISPECIES: response regulator [unclassified Paenibacillus]MCM3129113.1 response regulator [Paenibacillus sp. MER 78]SFS51936.1 two-component system, response regulator YesN [Paenibacillus sp. 453mf]
MQSTYTAILVDDEVFTRKGLMKIVDWESCGFRIVGEADNGEDALSLIRESSPDVVITDIRMPVLDGMGLIRQVISEEENEGTRPSFIIVSGYDDFSYAQQAVRYGVHDFILKPIDEEEFHTTLKKLSLRIQQERTAEHLNQSLNSSMLMDLILNEKGEPGAYREWEKRLNMDTGEEIYYVFAEINDIFHLSADRQSDIIQQCKAHILRWLQHVTCADRVYLQEHRNRFGFIITKRMLSMFSNNIRNLLEHLQTEVKLEGRLFLYTGKRVQGIASIRESYESAKQALLYKFIYDDTGIVILDDNHHSALKYLPLEEQMYRRVMEQIEESDMESLPVTIESMFRSFQEKNYAPEAMKMNIHQCVNHAVKVLKDMGGDEDRLDAWVPMTSWYDHNLSLKAIRDLFTKFAAESALYIAELRKEQGTRGIHKIKLYIDSHFQDNISLKSIAGVFYMNPVYLGQRFKKTYGLYFNDYLLHLRIQEAKKLLRQTDLRIYEIAERVGYGNSDYFVTQFEKLMQMSPSDYRQGLLKEGKSEEKPHEAKPE